MGAPKRIARSPNEYEPVRRDTEQIDLAALKAAGKEVAAAKGASLIDIGDGVLCLEFHSRANAVGQDAMELLGRALTMLEDDGAWRAMVIGNQGEYFSAGVDLKEVGAIARAAGPMRWRATCAPGTR